MTNRLARLRLMAQETGLAAVAVMPGPNFRYLTGTQMMLSERPVLLLLPASGEPAALCPAFEAERVREAGIDRVFTYTDETGPAPAAAAAVRFLNLSRDARWGLEYRHLRLLERELLAVGLAESGLELAYEDAGQLLAALRMRKDQAEVEAMARAAALTDEGMRLARDAIRPGVSELDVLDAVAAGLKRAGLRSEPEILVASGPRAAVPHAEASERVMEEGDLCWVDLVLTWDGYVGDITRTFAVGRLETVPEDLRRIYAVVEEAQARGREAARPGASGAQVDAAARRVIDAAGYGPYFTHRTGHGIGLDVHEDPYMVAGAEQPLEEGMAFTVEPGIYLPGRGGVRIEDDVVLVPGGARVLTGYPRHLTGSA
ncbi:MAG: M24 family metallopeptidase [Bacillota bacterium]